MSLRTLLACWPVPGALALGSVLTGCERRLFDVELSIVEATAIGGLVDDGAVEIAHQTVGDVGEPNGSSDERSFEFDADATRVHFEVRAFNVDEDAATLVGFGRTGLFGVPEPGGVIAATVLLAPVNQVGALTTLPPATGGDACVADDGFGHVFVAGGRASSQGAYVLNDRFEIVGFAGGFPTGVGGVGCAANAGVVAVTGGCTAGASSTVVLFDPDGGRRIVNAVGTQPCGAVAAPRRDGQVWFMDGDNRLDLLSSSGGVTTPVVAARAGSRRGFEVTAADAAVFVIDDELAWVDTALVPLGPAIALGRRGADVLVLDDVGTVAVVDNATTRPLAGVATVAAAVVGDVAHFVVTDDGTFVGLSVDGTTLHIVDGSGVAGGGSRTLSTTVVGATRVSTLPGGTVVIGGADVDGLQTVAFDR
jgi:hypothetical protein